MHNILSQETVCEKLCDLSGKLCAPNSCKMSRFFVNIQQVETGGRKILFVGKATVM